MGDRMNDQDFIAATMAQVTAGMGAVEDAVRELTVQKGMPPVIDVKVQVPEMKVDNPTPLVEVTVPVPEVNVTVPVPSVTVEAAKVPEVNVLVQAVAPATYVCEITKRDQQGLIKEFVITPVK